MLPQSRLSCIRKGKFDKAKKFFDTSKDGIRQTKMWQVFLRSYQLMLLKVIYN